jgi:MoaA/NifB/PqqE/SkfB family radical SAM enzyme
MTGTCHYVWDGVTIDRFGQVYACCLLKPGVLGNIYEAPLQDIINGQKARAHRAAARQGRLPCLTSCHLLTEEERQQEPEEQGDEVAPERLRFLHLGFGDACNIDCIMCRREVGNFTSLDPEVLARHVDERPFEDIAIQGGEPLAIRAARRYMRYLGERGKHYILLTNGLLIDDATADELVRNARKVVISINGATQATHERVNVGSHWSRVLENTTRLRSRRDHLGTSLELVARVTLVPENLDDIAPALRNFQQWGFDSINFGYDRRTVPQALAASPEWARHLRETIETALETIPAERVEPHRLRLLGLV